jgi:hypothetical protein
MTNAPNAPAKPPLMPLGTRASPWQSTMATQLVAALREAVRISPGATADATPNVELATGWRVARGDIAAASRQLAPPGGQAALYLRCLVHYRDELRAQDKTNDDAGVALACFICAALQALEGEAVTIPRWTAVTQWLRREVEPRVDWASASLDEQRDVFARTALLAAAVGEWSLEASKRDALSQETARTMARSHLQHELGLDADVLVDAARWLGWIPPKRV